MVVRREQRIPRYKPVKVLGLDEPYVAASVDYSEYGLGIVTTLSLRPGDSLKVSCPDFWPKVRDGVVVWVEPVTDSSSRAGLSLH